jgi:RNA polymerase sigma factor (TIGR02999 family)
MPGSESPDFTVWLSEWRAGDGEAGRKLMAAAYRELRRLAAVYLSREANAQTLQPTVLVNDLCVAMLSRRPVSCHDRAHFLSLAARQLRRLIVDHARMKKVLKRGGAQEPLPLDEIRDHVIPLDDRITEIDEVLTRLEALSPRPATVVEMRFFGGLTEQETADALGISVATVKRDWEFARCWLLAQLQPGSPASSE